MSEDEVDDDRKTMDAFHRNGITAIEFICRRNYSYKHQLARHCDDDVFSQRIGTCPSILVVETEKNHPGHAVAFIANIKIDPTYPCVSIIPVPVDGRIKIVGNQKPIEAAYLFPEIDAEQWLDRLIQETTTVEPPCPAFFEQLVNRRSDTES